MSYTSTPDPHSRRRSPKRKRSPSSTPRENGNTNTPSTYHTPANGTPSHNYETDPALQFAYEDDNLLDSAGGSAVRTPEELRSDAEDGDADGEGEGKAAERPKELDYVLHMTLKGHKRGVASVKFSPDGKWIASCSADCTIKIWSASTGALHQTLEGHLAGISTIAWSPDSRILASGSDDKLIRLWDVSTGKCLPQPLVGHHNYVYALAFSPKGNMLVSGSYDEAVFLWDIRTARLMRSLPAHSDPVSGVDFVRDGTLVVSCSSDGLIRIWDTGTGQCLKTLVHEDNAPVTSVRFSPNGKYVLAATLDSSLRLWNYVEGRCAKTYQGHKNEKFSIGVCFGSYTALPPSSSPLTSTPASPPEQQQEWAFIASGSEGGSAVLWDVSSKEVLQTLPGHEGVVLGVDFCAQSKAVATCGVDKTVRIWKRKPAGKVVNGFGHAEGGAQSGAEVGATGERVANGDMED